MREMKEYMTDSKGRQVEIMEQAVDGRRLINVCSLLDIVAPGWVHGDQPEEVNEAVTVWIKENGVAYYAAPSERFSKQDAYDLAAKIPSLTVVVEDLS